MATPRTPFGSSPRNSGPSRRFVRGLALMCTAAAVLVAPLPAFAGGPATSQEAAALVAAKGHDLEVVTEQFNTTREHLAAATGRARQAAAAASRAQADLAAGRDRVRSVARSAYTGTSLGKLQALLTSSSAGEFIGRLSTLDTIAERQNAVLSHAVTAQTAAARAQGEAQRSAEAAHEQFLAGQRQQDQLRQQIALYQADFNRLNADEKRAAQSAVAHDGGRASRADRSPSTSPAPAGPIVAGSAAVQSVIDAAMNQRGKPYVWAAAGPGSFDCSGLTQYAFAVAGVGLPHSSSMQAQMGVPVARSAARPGDLVSFYSPVSHIGIYLGNGQMIHAPTSGDVIKVASIDTMGGAPSFNRVLG